MYTYDFNISIQSLTGILEGKVTRKNQELSLGIIRGNKKSAMSR